MDPYEELDRLVEQDLPGVMARAENATAHLGDRSGWLDVADLLRHGAALADQIADSSAR